MEVIRKRQTGFFYSIFYLFFVTLTQIASPLRAEVIVRIDEQTPSLFFANTKADPAFDYAAWANHKKTFATKFDPARWNQLAPMPSPSQGIVNLNRAQAEALLLRFHKPGGFETDRHEAVMRAILTSRIFLDSPSLIGGALQNILATDATLYDRLVKAFPKLRQLNLANLPQQPFRTKAEEKLVRKASEQYLDQQVARLIPESNPLAGTRFSHWTNLRPLTPTLAGSRPDWLSSNSDSIMESLAFSAGKGKLRGVFASILAKFTEAVVGPLLSTPAEEVTNIEMVRRGDSVTPIILGTEPISENDKKNAYGFYTKIFPDIPVWRGMPEQKQTFRWTHGDKNYEAKVKLSLVNAHRLIVPSEPAPRYEELWRPLQPGGPKTLTGLIVFGSNIADDAPKTAKAYLSYFKDHGFKEVGRSQSSDLKGFLEKQLISGETSWFTKEAHSDGDDRNIFGVDPKSLILTLKRVHEGGEVEIVRIAYPTEPDAEKREKLISNIEFGKWMRSRARHAKKQLVFFNSSCWSIDKAQNEIPEAGTNIVAEVVTSTLTNYTLNRTDNGMRIVMDGLRRGKNWAEIRADLARDPGYVASTYDRFLFPDEPDYIRHVFHGFSPMRIRVSVRRDRGKAYDGKKLRVGCYSLGDIAS